MTNDQMIQTVILSTSDLVHSFQKIIECNTPSEMKLEELQCFIMSTMTAFIINNLISIKRFDEDYDINTTIKNISSSIRWSFNMVGMELPNEH